MLFSLIEEKIKTREYVFVKHAKERQITREISELEVLYILEGKRKYARKHNKQKDIFIDGRQDWNYCIEGINQNKEKIRVIVSFMENLMLIITVIKL